MQLSLLTQSPLPIQPNQGLEDVVDSYCEGDLRVLSPPAFYPVPWPDWRKLFDRGDLGSNYVKKNVTSVVHTWNELSSVITMVEVEHTSTYAKLAQANCPQAFQENLHI